MMPLGAPSISKYGSPVRPDAQIVALRTHCARTTLKAPPQFSITNVCIGNVSVPEGRTNRRSPMVVLMARGSCLCRAVGQSERNSQFICGAPPSQATPEALSVRVNAV